MPRPDLTRLFHLCLCGICLPPGTWFGRPMGRPYKFLWYLLCTVGRFLFPPTSHFLPPTSNVGRARGDAIDGQAFSPVALASKMSL